MSGDGGKAANRARVAELVRAFQRNKSDYLSAAYNETQARTDFITPLLEAFGWDVHNAAGQPLGLREVIEEATVEVGEEKLSKRPDYELRLARQRKLFIEAKKPSVHVDRSRDAAFQTRRYGYSASLPIAILTNFHQLAIYDCVPLPSQTDEAHVARRLLVNCEDFEARFDELWPLLSRAAVYSGEFDRDFAVDVTRRGANQFDDFFLRQVRSWRERLAIDIHRQNPALSPPELTYSVQIFLSRIVFLRICEDRDIERYETLRGLAAANAFDALMIELRRADDFYDSGLFRLLDDTRLGIRISDEVLSGIIDELYYPQSPYTFAVVETEVLGEIYEQFLGEVITFNAAGEVEIAFKPEIRESGGVVPTPRFIWARTGALPLPMPWSAPTIRKHRATSRTRSRATSASPNASRAPTSPWNNSRPGSWRLPCFPDPPPRPRPTQRSTARPPDTSTISGRASGACSRSRPLSKAATPTTMACSPEPVRPLYARGCGIVLALIMPMSRQED